MPFEIDFLPVGTASKSGDAIALRYGPCLEGPNKSQTVITIDGGTKDSGNALVKHVQNVYGTNVVDFAILTHPDNDHASGMRAVLEQLRVNNVIMHLPWNHSASVKQLIDDDRTTHKSLKNRAEENLVSAKEVEDLAIKQRCNIHEPFAGLHTADGVLTFLGPSREFYQQRLANFRFMPGTTKLSFLEYFNLQETAKQEREDWYQELLATPSEDASSAENNSSAILLVQIDGHKILFTGDAGTPALTGALDYAAANSIVMSGISLFQIPHHGSRKNLSIPIMNRLFGPIRKDDLVTFTAIVSAAVQGAPKHPNKKVTNSIRRRGGGVASTANGHFLYYHGTPVRPGFGPYTPMPFFAIVDSDAATA